MTPMLDIADRYRHLANAARNSAVFQKRSDIAASRTAKPRDTLQELPKATARK